MTDNKRIVVFVSGISDHFNAACVSIIGGVSMSNYTSVNLAVADPRFYTGGTCRAMITKGMVFRYTWVYSKEDTMAHTCRLVVTS